MSTEQTQRTIDRYFEMMGREADFAECFTEDVTWLIADTGEIVRNPCPVRDYIVALHAAMEDAHTSKFVVGEDDVYLEGDCAPTAPGTGNRTHYCIAYDMKDDQITAVRCYGLGARATV